MKCIFSRIISPYCKRSFSVSRPITTTALSAQNISAFSPRMALAGSDSGFSIPVITSTSGMRSCMSSTDPARFNRAAALAE
jgi:hypothetical protein